VSPLGDILKRRQLILALILSSASLTVGFALTSSLLVIKILAFFIGLSTIAPQIIIALTRDHAHPSKSSFAYSIILSGYLSGILLGRLFSGVIAQWTSWHFVFYFAFATQYAIFVLCYFTIPDFPAKNSDLSYTMVLWTMLKYAVTEPAVVQIELVSMALGAAIANYSVTLTFLLGGAPYYYSE